MSNFVSRLGVVLSMDTAEFTNSVNKAIAENGKLKNAIIRNSQAAEKEIDRLKYATENYGKALTEVDKMRRETEGEWGRYKNASEAHKKELLAQAAAYDKVVAAQQKSMMTGSKAFQMNVQQRAALAYQTTDILTGLASGQNPLIVMIQQGGQLRDQFGGFGNMFKGIAQALSIFRVAVVGVGGALAGLVYFGYKGNQEFKEFRNSLALSGNVAGFTLDSFRGLSKEIGSNFNVSVSDAKDILLELVKSGRVSKDSMQSFAGVIATVSKLSGETASEVAKSLIPSFDGTAASAKRLNDQYNFLTFAQYKQIEAMEKAGEKSEAARLTADLLNKSLEKQKQELQITEGYWGRLTRSVSDFIDKIKQIGVPETTLESINRISQAIGQLNEQKNLSPKQQKIYDLYIKQYQEFAAKYQEEVDKANKKANKQEGENKKIADEIQFGEKRKALAAEYERLKNEVVFQEAMFGASELERITLESNKKKADAVAAYMKAFEEDQGKLKWERAKVLIKQIEGIELEAAQKRKKISQDEAKLIFEDQQAKLNALVAEEEKLKLYQDNLFLTEAQLDIALSRLRTEQEIEKVLRNQKLEEVDKLAAVQRLREIQAKRETISALSEDLKMAEKVNKSVFQNMEQAIENFVRTGKMSFKDFARSVIQDILAIYMKSQLLSMFSAIPGFGTAFRYGTNIGSQQTSMLAAQDSWFRASGGPVSANSPYIVGEQGPELFVPRNAGTIVPNHGLSGMGGVTNVTNNYINAIDTKSFEDRLLGSANAIWAANQYANKSLAVGRGRA